MSFKNFPATQKVKIIDGVSDAGALQVTTSTFLKHAVFQFYIKGAFTTEKIKLNIYGSETKITPVAVSNWVTLSEIAGFNGGNWLGNLRFDFSGISINSNYKYFMAFDTLNYTRNASIKYLAYVCQYATALNAMVGGNQHGPYVSIIGER